jgi:dienelactone hydrolase
MVLHELPGLSPACIEFAERLVADRFRVFLPLLFGSPCDDSVCRAIKQPCLRREFHLFAIGATSPIATWLRAACAEVNRRVGGDGVAIVGLCLTGGLALVLIADPTTTTAVTSEPALPLPLIPGYRRDLGISSDDLSASRARVERDDRRILALRFSADLVCTRRRFHRMRTEFGDRVEQIVIKSPDRSHRIPLRAHSVLTTEFRDVPNHPTLHAYRRVVDFLRVNSKPTAAPVADTPPGDRP